MSVVSSNDARAWLGAGFGLRLPHASALAARRAAGDAGPPVLELTPSHMFARPELLDELAANHAIVLHDVYASLGTVGPVDREHLERVATLARRCRAVDYSEHLALTRSPSGLDLGHLIPLPRTHAQLAVLVDHVHAVQDLLALPIAIELPATTITLPGDELDEAEFVARLVDQSGCELHLDLENLRVDALNEGSDPRAQPQPRGHARAELSTDTDTDEQSTLRHELAAAGVPPPLDRSIARRLAGLPLDAVTRVHLAGGHLDADGWAVDSHRAPVSELAFAILVALRGHLRPRAIIIERDDRLPPLAELIEQAEHAAQLWLG